MSSHRLLPVAVAGILLFIAAESEATTCSCAAVPLLGSMELATPGDGKWFLAGTYEFHDVSELISGSSKIPDTTGRDRTSEALIIEASKGLTKKLSISTLLSIVKHDRTIGGAHDGVTGLGDAILMLKYSPATISLYSRHTISFGIGARLPLGEDSAMSNGVVLAEDLQPSTGAFGGILWGYTARALNESASARIYASASYIENGENNRDYQFGNETTVSVGASYQTQSAWGFNTELIYRQASRDERASSTIPNTGGKWLDFIPAVQYHINDSIALRLSTKIPVSRDLNDQLQFTTKYAARLTFSYVFGN